MNTPVPGRTGTSTIAAMCGRRFQQYESSRSGSTRLHRRVRICALCRHRLLWVLVHYFSWWYLAAATTSFLAGLIVAYALSVMLVFKRRRLKDPRLEFVR